MLQQEPWWRDESLWIAISNLGLVGILVVLGIRNNWLAAIRRRATRKVLQEKRANKGLRYALKVSVNQYQSLRRKFDRRRPLVAPTPVVIEARPDFIVPPPLDLAQPDGDDPRSWADSAIHTQHRPSSLPLSPDDTQTQPIPMAELMRLTRPPRK